MILVWIFRYFSGAWIESSPKWVMAELLSCPFEVWLVLAFVFSLQLLLRPMREEIEIEARLDSILLWWFKLISLINIWIPVFFVQKPMESFYWWLIDNFTLKTQIYFINLWRIHIEVNIFCKFYCYVDDKTHMELYFRS